MLFDFNPDTGLKVIFGLMLVYLVCAVFMLSVVLIDQREEAHYYKERLKLAVADREPAR